MAARVLSCAFWLQRLSLLRWFTITMAQHVFACATHRSLLDGISGLRLPDTAVYPRFSLLRTSREAGGYACTSAPEGWGLHPHEDGVTRLCSLAACLEVRTSFQPTGHRSDLVVDSSPHMLRAAQPLISHWYTTRSRKTNHKIKSIISIC
jgi:hypothetical protein